MVIRVAHFALLALCVLSSRPAAAETLADALARAVAVLPEVRAARANLRAIEQTEAQARGGWYPTIDATFGQGRETANNPSTRAIGTTPPLNRREAELSISQLLFDGGATSGQVHRAKALATSADDLVANAAESAGGRVVQAYLDVVRLRALIAIAIENEKRHRETLAQVSRLADVGQGRRADAQQADARLALAQASLTQLRGQLAQSEASFRHLTGQPPGALAEPQGYARLLPESLPAAIAQAMQSQPLIRSAQQELLAAQAERASARSRAFSPRLALEIGSSADHNLGGIRGLNGDQFAMLRLRYNLFRGGTDDAKIREAEARVDEARANADKARNDTERDLRQAWQTLVEDRVRLPQLQRYAAASAQVVRSYRLQFSIGQRTLLDVLNAENELFTARSNEDTGRYAVTTDELRVLATMGRLLAALGVAIDPAPAEPGAAPRRSYAIDTRPEAPAPTKSVPPEAVTALPDVRATVHDPAALRMSTSLGTVAATR